MLALCTLAATSFVPHANPIALAAARRAPAMVSMADIPRITLPDAVADVIKEQGLNSPNDLDTTAYNNYSAAAIGGTLILFILPLFDFVGFIGDFVLSALIGGGALAYLSLRKDDLGEYGGKFGGIVMTGIDKAGPLAGEAKTAIEKLIKDITG